MILMLPNKRNYAMKTIFLLKKKGTITEKVNFDRLFDAFKN